MKRNTSLTDMLQRNQRNIVRDLKGQVKETNEILKLIATAQDVNAVRKEHMEFLGIVGSRTLSKKEIDTASKEGIPFDELRRITGRNIECCMQNESLRNSLGPGHILRMVLAEHEMILYFVNDIETTVACIAKCKTWSDKAGLVEKVRYLIKHLASMDGHQLREEKVIFESFRNSGFEDVPAAIFSEHAKLGKGKDELRKLCDSSGKGDYRRWVGKLETVLSIWAPGVKQHIFAEENVVYPRALKIIQDPNKWAKMKAAAEEDGICCFEK